MITRNNYLNVLLAGLLLFTGCGVNKAKSDPSLKKYFDEAGVTGTFTMLDNATGQITVYNMALDTLRVSPASTFKILNALIGLQTGAILNDTSVMKWNGVPSNNIEWNSDLAAKDAFQKSCVPCFQEVARKIGYDTLKLYTDSLSYGNKNIGGKIDEFWLNDTLKISADEQLGFMKKLYFDQLPFRKSVQQTVRNWMLMEDNTLYKLSYKTGFMTQTNGTTISWVVGFAEENRHVYPFATMVQIAPKPNQKAKPLALQITKNIMRSYGFFQGKK